MSSQCGKATAQPSQWQVTNLATENHHSNSDSKQEAEVGLDQPTVSPQGLQGCVQQGTVLEQAALDNRHRHEGHGLCQEREGKMLRDPVLPGETVPNGGSGSQDCSSLKVQTQTRTLKANKRQRSACNADAVDNKDVSLSGTQHGKRAKT